MQTIFDAHLHITEPCFLVIENQGFDQNYRIDSLLALSNKKAVDQHDQIPLFN